MEAGPYADISISGLCRAAGVSRPTFYSLFGSKDDVVAYILRESHCYAPEPEAGSCLKSFCASYSEYITRQRHFLALLVNNGVGYLLYQSIFDTLMDCGCFLSGADAVSRRCAANFTAGALTGVARDYAAREACDSGELCRLLESLFGGSLFG